MAEDQMICPYCDTMLERPRPRIRERVVERVVTRRPQPIQTPVQTGSAVGGIVVMAVIMVVVIGFVVFGILMGELEIGLSRDHVSGWAPILVPTEHEQAPDLLLVTRNLNADNYDLMLLDGVTRAVRLRKPLGEKTYNPVAVVHGDHVYVVDEAHLYALDLAEGQTAWEAVLADVLADSRGDCLQVFGERVVALTKDGMVQAFDTRTGKPAWSVRLSETPRQLYRAAGQPAVLDKKEGDKSAHLVVFDPADGTVVWRFTPACRTDDHPWDQTAGVHSPIQVDDARNVVYVLFGHDPMCVQCVNGTTGDPVWTATVADLHYAWVEELALAGDALYVTNHVRGGALDVVDVSQGTARRLTDEQDYRLMALAAQTGSVAVVHAVRTRGSEQHELWGLDPATGERRWQYVLQGLNASGGNWAARLVPQGLAVLRVPDDEAQLHVEILDLEDAQVLQSSTFKLVHDDLGAVTWTNTRAYVTSWGKLYAVDLATGELEFAWP
jgi:outer membrane protein assembly factor BamB